MMKSLLFAALLFASAGRAHAQTEVRKHPIDVALDTCVSKNPSTQGTNQCFYEAGRQWDAELNRAYRKLITLLNPVQKKALLTSQRLWLQHRDAEAAFQRQFYGAMQGTMYSTFAASDHMEVVRKRAMLLNTYLDVLEMK